MALVEDTSRESANELMGLTGYRDVLIPRGGAGLIRAVVEKASTPAVLGGFSSLLQAVEGNFETNLPQDQVLALASAMGGDWQVETYTASGYSAYRETYSMPGQELYVILPDQASVEQAAALLKETLAA